MEGIVHSPKVSFSLIPGDGTYDVEERYSFWDSPDTINWLKSHGYTLYHRTNSDIAASCPALPFEPFSEANFPYAYYDSESYSDEDRLLVVELGGKVAFAQDSLGRHVVVKLVRAETDEFRILKMLSEQSLDTLKENCVIPVLDMLPIEGFWFVVMPRWASDICLPRPQFLYEIIAIMHSILKGLVFLHTNGIAHGDLLTRNVLVNHFTNTERLVFQNDTRRELRSKNRLRYALFDFDFSVLLPHGTQREDFRLPYWRSWGDMNRIPDTGLGEFDYDPFAFDVGVLGVVFCDFFQHLTPEFPMLAPLLDMMTTRHLDRRFTASQALQFLEEASSELSAQHLITRVTVLKTYCSYFKYDRWQNLPPEFVQEWKHYRETPVPWAILALRRFCRRKYVRHIVPRIRWFFFQLFSIPRTILWFMSSSRQIARF